IDSTTALAQFLDGLGECDGQPPRFYMDCEGNNLSRQGTLSLLTILLEPENEVHLIDVTTLGRLAFTTPGKDGRTLQAILESSKIVKVFFDIRNDSDALYSLHGIRVQGIEDIQLMELASRSGAKRTVNGLARCIQQATSIGWKERSDWKLVKEKGQKLFDPARGGGYHVFDKRPLSEEITSYCTQDVAFMPILRRAYRRDLCDAWWREIERETQARVQLSQSRSYQGKGRHMAEGPPRW
ncbi:ribonuclease H-like domain-containing protein, partial [Elsinoe ampelina]